MMDALLEVPAPDELPEGWRVGPVLDFFQLQRGHDLPVQDRRDGPVPVIASNGAVGFHDKSPLPGPGVVTGRSGTIGNVSFVEGAYWPLNTTLYVKDFKGTDPKFAYYFLKNFPLKDHQTGTGVPTLNRNDVHAVEVQFPPLDEQQRIAEVLRSVDEAIAANKAELMQSENFLSALAAELFAPSLSEASDGWEQHTLEDMLGNIIDYRGIPPPKSERGVPLLTAKNVRFGFLDFEPREFIAEEDYDSWMRRGLPKVGNIMFTTEAPLGNIAEFPDIKAALGQRTLTLVPKPDVLDAKFLKWLLLSGPAQELIWSHATGSTAKGIKQRTFRKLKFGFPKIDEQKSISKLLEDVAAARDASKRCVEAYAIMKVQLAADLLSGRVRVPISNVVPIRSTVQPAFKRAVFAAEIVHQLHNDNKFGSVKHEKIVHLCELHIGLHDALDRHAYKEAAGPYDPKARRSVESIFAKQKWFKAHKPDGIRVVYAPLEKCGGHEPYYDRYFGTHKTEIQQIIDLLRPLDTERCEIIATLYAVWNDFLIDGKQPTDQEIVTSVMTDWHPKKKQIAEGRWLRALPWMRQQQLIPSGKGEKTRVKAT